MRHVGAVVLVLRTLWASAFGGAAQAAEAVSLAIPREPVTVSDLLDRISRQTDMRVVYEGPPPQQLVKVDLAEVPLAEVVFRALEGLGINYVAQMDARSTRVETLIIISNDASTPRAQGARPPEPEPVLIGAPNEVPVIETPEPDAAASGGIQEIAPGIALRPEVRVVPPSPLGAQEIAPGIVYRPEVPIHVPVGGAQEIAPGIVYRPEAPKAPAPSPPPQ